MVEERVARNARASTVARRLFALVAVGLVLGSAPLVAAQVPKLVVVVSIDQFPRVYLDRFAGLFGAGGFRRLLDAGADFSECRHGHAATWTGPGHATILTAAYPHRTGIIGNTWFSRTAGGIVGCVEDENAPLLGGASGTGVSPRRLRAPALGDVLRSATSGRAKVVAVAGKDRAAVLLGGLHPNGAYWFDEETCSFVSSQYYAAALPDWVRDFNDARPCARYIGTNWEKLRGDVDYERFSAADDRAAEADEYGLGRVFPHPIREWSPPSAAGAAAHGERYHAIEGSPFGNELVLRFAVEALRGEGLGRDDVPDLLAIGFSSNDLIGHFFGPFSQEVLDATLRTDRMLAELMKILDRQVGKGKWTLALTSDHGVAPIPEELQKLGLLDRDRPYRFSPERARARVEAALREKLLQGGTPPSSFAGFVAEWSSQTHPFVYLADQVEAAIPGATRADLLAATRREIAALPGVARVYTAAERERLAASRDDLEQRVYRAWDERNGGDLLVVLAPYWLATPFPAGSTHGSPYEYDTHVPLLLFGAGIRRTRVDRAVAVVDLAPTLARLLGVDAPPLNQGRVLGEALVRPR